MEIKLDGRSALAISERTRAGTRRERGDSDRVRTRVGPGDEAGSDAGGVTAGQQVRARWH